MEKERNKPLLVGHWGTAPVVERADAEDDADAIKVTDSPPELDEDH